MGVLKAFISALKAVSSKKELCRKLLAYGYAVCEMRSADGGRADEPPGIYELDKVTDYMNGDIDRLNENFGLKAKKWRRNEVRVLMEVFGDIHGRLSDAEGRRLTVPETIEKILTFMKQPFWRMFRLYRELDREGRT